MFAECSEPPPRAHRWDRENALRALPGAHLHRQRGVELKKKERNRVLPFHESRVVAFADGPSDKTAFNRPAVYEDELLAAGLSAETCLTDKTTDSNFGGRQRRSLRPAAATIRRHISHGSDRRALL